MKVYPQVLSIAGSDSGGGAGIQADLKVFQTLGVFGTSVITAITAQNTQGVHRVYPLSIESVKAQILAIRDDFSIKAFKIGALCNVEIIECVASTLETCNFGVCVLDPVMVAKNGALLLEENAISSLKKHLLPKTNLLTPNLPEVYALTGIKVCDDKSALKAMCVLRDLGVKNAVIKGGHTKHFQGEFSNDWVFLEKEEFILNAKRFNTPNTHGTGCVLSSLIVGLLAQGLDLKNAIIKAKEYLNIIIQNPLNIGHGHGPLNLWSIKEYV
ncbi:bifunctional hydroxymethylpyrimidine kinase/phosphomethylpyrimidine kinase [Helicobacter cetorum]|uniref:hydroxymethylpyrimidine kinase n=1 Tax=Helicobacter cetorum (strain ATCC BAA-540 / CCUG 52418 / MIT 99-5656) TaxID=1163745 RepID=I0ER04_HELCM|nr:bifunctional hydroxymethylpyrimidine kinase/phosphomethylpyrimidine kinase [Helicobacter cetorum]AFI05373.1 thiamine biosynthesis protein (thi) [Helicobacter cetorum MIT 99-5656]